MIGYENRVLIVLFFAFGFVFFDRLAISFLFPFIQGEMNLTNSDLGVLSAVLALTWSISGPTLGIFAGRTRRKIPLFALLILLFSLISFGAGLITTFVTLLLLRGLMGIVEGPVLPIAQSIMAVESSENRRGLNMGLVQTSSASLLASTLGPMILVGIAVAYGWRYGFYFTILPGILIAICALLFLDEPKQVNISAFVKQEDQEKITFMDCLKFRNIWLCILLAICLLSWYLLMVTFAPTYLMNAVKMAPEHMSIAMAGLGLGGVIWGFGVPTISDRLGRKTSTIIAAFVCMFSPLALIFLHFNYILLAVVLVFVHCAQGAHVLILSVIPSETVPQKYIPASVGLIMGIGEVVGGVIMPVVAGRAADAINPAAPFVIAAVCALVAGFLAFGLQETAPLKLKRKSVQGNS